MDPYLIFSFAGNQVGQKKKTLRPFLVNCCMVFLYFRYCRKGLVIKGEDGELHLSLRCVTYTDLNLQLHVYFSIRIL